MTWRSMDVHEASILFSWRRSVALRARRRERHMGLRGNRVQHLRGPACGHAVQPATWQCRNAVR